MTSKVRQMISEHTPISIGLVITLIGAVVWATTIYAKAESNSQAIQRIEDSQKEYYKNLQEINERLSRIEGRLSRRP